MCFGEMIQLVKSPGKRVYKYCRGGKKAVRVDGSGYNPGGSALTAAQSCALLVPPTDQSLPTFKNIFQFILKRKYLLLHFAQAINS